MEQRAVEFRERKLSRARSHYDDHVETSYEFLVMQSIAFSHISAQMMSYNAVSHFFTDRYADSVLAASCGLPGIWHMTSVKALHPFSPGIGVQNQSPVCRRLPEPIDIPEVAAVF